MKLVIFLVIVVLVALLAAFILGVIAKWGIVGWLQIHAPSDFFHKMFSCKFCLSWWVSVIISLILCLVTGDWILALVPVFSTIIAKELW